MSGENEFLHFIAIVPSNTDFDKGNFVDVRSPNPEDIAQYIIKELSKSNQITVTSFGPRTVTSHSYLVGQVSVLDSLLHSFADAKIEVKVILRNSKWRHPYEPKSYYSIKTNHQIDELFKRVSSFPNSDYIKVTLYIQKYTIVFVSLPPFIPFNSKGSMKFQINGWNVLANPSSFIHTRGIALLHFDPNLPTESTVLKFLPNEERAIEVTNEDIEELEEAVLIENEETYDDYGDDEEYSSDEEDSKNNNSKYAKNRESSNLLHGKESSASIGSRHSRHSIKSQDRQSIKSQDRQSIKSNGRQPIEKVDAKNKSAGVNDDSNNEPTWANENNSDNNDDEQQNNAEYNENSEPSQGNQQTSSSKGRSKKQRTRRVIRKKKPTTNKQTIDIQQLIDSDGKYIKTHDSESSIPTEANFNSVEEEEEEDNSIEIQIQQFVSKLQLNIPVLTDTSVFSTLFQQLFYERWKSGILSRARTDLSNLRDHIKDRSTEEIAALKQLVNTQDLSLFISREEQRMRMLEAKTIEVMQQVMEKRLSGFANVTTKGLLKSYQTVCGDHVTLQRQLREKRAEIRALVMDFKIAQTLRQEKLMDYNQKVEELEKAASAQSRMEATSAELNKIRQEKSKLEVDRASLIQQREKVRNLLETKRLEKQRAAIKSKK